MTFDLVLILSTLSPPVPCRPRSASGSVGSLSATSSPEDRAIIGEKGRAELLRASAKGLDIPVDKIVPSDMEIEERMREMQQQVQAEGQVAPPVATAG